MATPSRARDCNATWPGEKVPHHDRGDLLSQLIHGGMTEVEETASRDLESQTLIFHGNDRV
jgi:hypothetical protein